MEATLTFPIIPAMLSASSAHTSRCSAAEPLSLSSQERDWYTPLNAVVIVHMSISRRYCSSPVTRDAGVSARGRSG